MAEENPPIPRDENAELPVPLPQRAEEQQVDPLAAPPEEPQADPLAPQPVNPSAGDQRKTPDLLARAQAAQTAGRALSGDATAVAKVAQNPEGVVGDAMGVSKESQETIKTARNYGTNTISVVSFLFNPAVLMVLGLAILSVAVFITAKSTGDVIGRNPNACVVVQDCSVNKAVIDGGGTLNTKDVTGLARQISWPNKKVGACRPVSNGCGKSASKPEYRDAKAKAEKAGGADGLDLFSSCDRFVATVVRLTTDKKMPWGNTETQRQYMKGSSKWKKRTSGAPKPGDVLVTIGPGHILMQLDKGEVAQASYGQYTAKYGKQTFNGSGVYTSAGDSRRYEAYYFAG